MIPVDPERIEFENFEIVSKDAYKVTIQIPLNSAPYNYLADHVFRNIPILPGTFFIELALNGYFQLYGKYPEMITNLKFLQPVILERAEIQIDIKVAGNTPQNLSLHFSENQTNLNAELELHFGVEIPKPSGHRNFNLPDFIKSADILDPENFYSELYKNGNQYGPHFRNLKTIWKKGNQALAQLTTISGLAGNKNHILHTSLLDSAIHLISALTNRNGEVFILDSINKIIILNTCAEDEVWCIAELTPVQSEYDGFEGNVDIVSPSGDIYIKLSGVRFKYPEQLLKSKSRKRLVLAGSFTIDPLMDSLKFWNHYFDYPFDIEFAPYGQIFQQLLDPSGLLRKNNDGINIILLNLEDWINSKPEKLTPVLSEEESSSLLWDKPVYLLPDKTKIVHLNKYETDYLYNEIFNDKVYIREGITINDGDTIIDIGANIGLFTLFVNLKCKEPHVFSFEPSREVYEVLKINSRLYGAHTKVYNKGVSDRRKREIYTYYPDSTVFSGFASDETEDREVLGRVIKNIIEDKIQTDDINLKKYTDEISGGRLKSEFYECDVISVSDIIEENKIQKVDLLKIDAEKSELEILNGIKSEDWPKIKQIVMEVHDNKGGKLEKTKSILKEKGFLVSVKEENYLQNAGLFNVYARREINTNSDQILASQDLEQNLKLFLDSVSSFAKNSRAQLIIGFTPASYESLSERGLEKSLKDAEVNLAAHLSTFSNINIIKSDDFLMHYRLKDYYDRYSNELGHIPYNSDFFTSLGSTIIRKIISLISSDFKVIVLDCDNTLWKGICGEDGYEGVKITENYKQLQNFMIDQMNSGKLICLCSKNNEKDVWNIFERRYDMILTKGHIVSSRINWDSKSKNLESLSSELNLGLDSFIFIDDNPVECEEVRNNCPSVLTLQLPEDENSIPDFLRNTWIFDKNGITEEDKKRSLMYKENIARNMYERKSSSLRDFINGLGLNISIYEPCKEQLGRISQLTYRTNQFNLTSIRRNESEIGSLLNDDNFQCVIMEVSDRFGNYGIVGVLIYEFHHDKIIVDTFLLSCRILGKGVEYKILSELGKIALNKGIKEIEIRFVSNDKNKPASDFIYSLKFLHIIEQEGEILFRFLPEYLSDLKYEPDDRVHTGLNSSHNTGKKFNHSNPGNFSSAHFQKIAEELYDINLLRTEIEKINLNGDEENRKDIIAPRNNLEIMLSPLWAKVLGKKNISTYDNFFESGGTSLKAIQLIAAINKELEADLSIISLFEYPTINSLAQYISSVNPSSENNQTEEIMERGARRRNLSHKRKMI